MNKRNNWQFMRRKVLGHWLWIPCRMKKKKAKGRHGEFPRVTFVQSREYRRFVLRRYKREGYFAIGLPLFRQYYPQG